MGAGSGLSYGYSAIVVTLCMVADREDVWAANLKLREISDCEETGSGWPRGECERAASLGCRQPGA